MAGHLHPHRLEGGDLFGSRSFSALDDRPGMAHPLAGRGRLAGDEGGDRLGHVVGDELRCPLLVAAADLADQHHLLGVRVVLEQGQHVDESRCR